MIDHTQTLMENQKVYAEMYGVGTVVRINEFAVQEIEVYFEGVGLIPYGRYDGSLRPWWGVAYHQEQPQMTTEIANNDTLWLALGLSVIALSFAILFFNQ